MIESSTGYGYSGEWYDAATGMQNLRARQYEPAMTRFGQPDIIRGSASYPASQNRYAYVWNDPVNLVDRNGLLPTAIADSNASGADIVAYYENIDGKLKKTEAEKAKTAYEVALAAVSGMDSDITKQLAETNALVDRAIGQAQGRIDALENQLGRALTQDEKDKIFAEECWNVADGYKDYWNREDGYFETKEGWDKDYKVTESTIVLDAMIKGNGNLDVATLYPTYQNEGDLQSYRILSVLNYLATGMWNDNVYGDTGAVINYALQYSVGDIEGILQAGMSTEHLGALLAGYYATEKLTLEEIMGAIVDAYSTAITYVKIAEGVLLVVGGAVVGVAGVAGGTAISVGSGGVATVGGVAVSVEALAAAGIMIQAGVLQIAAGVSGDAGGPEKSENKTVQGKSQAPSDGEPGSYYEQVDDNGQVISRTYYGENGKVQYRDDLSGRPHFSKELKRYLAKHRHTYTYNESGQPTGETVTPLP